MGDLTQAVQTGAMVGNLPTASLLGILVIILAIIAYRTYNDGIKAHGEKLDKITAASEKMAQETHDLNTTTKASLETAKETRELLIKSQELQNAKTQEKLDEMQRKIERNGCNIELKKVDGKLLWTAKPKTQF